MESLEHYNEEFKLNFKFYWKPMQIKQQSLLEFVTGQHFGLTQQKFKELLRLGKLFFNQKSSLKHSTYELVNIRFSVRMFLTSTIACRWKSIGLRICLVCDVKVRPWSDVTLNASQKSCLKPSRVKRWLVR